MLRTLLAYDAWPIAGSSGPESGSRGWSRTTGVKGMSLEGISFSLRLGKGAATENCTLVACLQNGP
jgi:hypothetical protein